MNGDQTVLVSDLALGQFRLTSASDHFPDVFVGRISSPGELPFGTVDAGGRECFVAYSRTCTHLGCSLVPLDNGDLGKLPMGDDETVIRCPCHFSCFDLTNRGLVVLGPATACLPQVELEPVGDPVTHVRLVQWMREASAPYGVPYEGTSAVPPPAG